MSAQPSFVLGYVIEFSDGGPDESGFLHRGTLESCQRLQTDLPAIAYSGDRPVKGARTVIVEGGPSVEVPNGG